MAESAITPTNVTAIAQAPDLFSDTRIQMIRDSVARGAPPDVFAAMIDIARRRNLDPLAKQIQVVQFGSSWQIITTIDGYRAIAEQTGAYAGSDAPVFTWYEEPVKTSAGKLVPESATVTVYKLVHGQRYPFSATVFWEEFDGKKNNWLSMPRVMLAKVAESHALRKAFPAVLSGTDTPEEMDHAVIEGQGRYVDQGTGEITPARSAKASRATATVSPSRGTASRSGVGQGSHEDGKRLYWRNRLTKLTEAGGWGEADLDAIARHDFDSPLAELDGDLLEALYRDLEKLHQDNALDDYLREVRTWQAAGTVGTPEETA
jgi:phage recombination protein Bet